MQDRKVFTIVFATLIVCLAMGHVTPLQPITCLLNMIRHLRTTCEPKDSTTSPSTRSVRLQTPKSSPIAHQTVLPRVTSHSPIPTRRKINLPIVPVSASPSMPVSSSSRALPMPADTDASSSSRHAYPSHLEATPVAQQDHILSTPPLSTPTAITTPLPTSPLPTPTSSRRKIHLPIVQLLDSVPAAPPTLVSPESSTPRELPIIADLAASPSRAPVSLPHLEAPPVVHDKSNPYRVGILPFEDGYVHNKDSSQPSVDASHIVVNSGDTPPHDHPIFSLGAPAVAPRTTSRRRRDGNLGHVVTSGGSAPPTGESVLLSNLNIPGAHEFTFSQPLPERQAPTSQHPAGPFPAPSAPESERARSGSIPTPEKPADPGYLAPFWSLTNSLSSMATTGFSRLGQSMGV